MGSYCTWLSSSGRRAFEAVSHLNYRFSVLRRTQVFPAALATVCSAVYLGHFFASTVPSSSLSSSRIVFLGTSTEMCSERNPSFWNGVSLFSTLFGVYFLQQHIKRNFLSLMRENSIELSEVESFLGPPFPSGVAELMSPFIDRIPPHLKVMQGMLRREFSKLKGDFVNLWKEDPVLGLYAASVLKRKLQSLKREVRAFQVTEPQIISRFVDGPCKRAS